MPPTFKSITKLGGSRVIIFGGTSGIGFAVAAAALEHGASVFVTSSKKDNVDSAVATLKSSYPGEEYHCRIAGAACDLSSPETLESNLIELFEAVTRPDATQEIQPIDHIVFTAGDLLKLVPLSESTAESIQASGVVRFLAPLLIGKLAPRYMRVSNRSSITLTSGSMARRPEKHWTVLAAYAAGNEGMRFGMGIDLAPIRVNVVAPGAVMTPLLERLPASEWERWRRQLLTEELGKAEDVAEAYIYSMKDRSATGALIDSSDGRLFS
ncbi:hypothetical protein AbraIFM66950_010200 [Aspergillus brasiliensis]|nr:hypothetical protein AbraIFM66950_010200 [Aspergillus brasiliensis]